VNAFTPHLEVLPAAQREIWPLLAPSIGLGLVLYGGTAAALRLGHRNSIDFDFFTERLLDRDRLEGSFEFFGRSRLIQDRKDTLTILAPAPSGTVKISFFGEITFGRIGIPDRAPDGAMEVASLLDLLATKLKVILQRIEAKDYRDVAAMLRSGLRLESGLAAASALYRPAFQPSEAIKALASFEGGDLSTLDSRDRSTLIHAVSSVRHVPTIGVVSHSLSAS